MHRKMDIRDKQRTRKLASSMTEWTTCWRALNGGETCTPSEVRWGRRERAMSTGKRRSTQRQMWRISRREAVHGGRGSGLHQRSGRHHHAGSAVLRSSTFRANRSHRTLGVTTLTLTRTGTRPVNTSGSSPPPPSPPGTARRMKAATSRSASGLEVDVLVDETARYY
jgi:hypothetical protein